MTRSSSIPPYWLHGQREDGEWTHYLCEPCYEDRLRSVKATTNDMRVESPHADMACDACRCAPADFDRMARQEEAFERMRDEQEREESLTKWKLSRT